MKTSPEEVALRAAAREAGIILTQCRARLAAAERLAREKADEARRRQTWADNCARLASMAPTVPAYRAQATHSQAEADKAKQRAAQADTAWALASRDASDATRALRARREGVLPPADPVTRASSAAAEALQCHAQAQAAQDAVDDARRALLAAHAHVHKADAAWLTALKPFLKVSA